MARAITTEVHTRSHRVLIGHKQLEEMIAKAAAEMVEFNKPKIGRAGVTYKVELTDAMEGSPPYRVGTQATVTIIEDMMPQAGDA